jgi:hypothetical protein
MHLRRSCIVDREKRTIPQSSHPAEPTRFRESLLEALRFWEPGRLIYNFVLSVVVMEWLVITWPHFRPTFNISSLGLLIVLALLANVCYCAAYVVDVPMLRSSMGAAWSAAWSRGRWGLWLVGTLFAILLANYWIADEIYPFIGQ